MTLYSPSLTSKPRNAVNALYRSPREWGNSICLRKSMRLPRPQPQVPVTHSPTPSTVRIAASSNGEHRKALAAWERWCSQNRTRSLGIPNSAEIVLNASKSLLFRRSDQLAIAQQCCCRIVVIAGNSEDVHLALAASPFQIDDIMRMFNPFGRT